MRRRRWRWRCCDIVKKVLRLSSAQVAPRNPLRESTTHLGITSMLSKPATEYDRHISKAPCTTRLLPYWHQCDVRVLSSTLECEAVLTQLPGAGSKKKQQISTAQRSHAAVALAYVMLVFPGWRFGQGALCGCAGSYT